MYFQMPMKTKTTAVHALLFAGIILMFPFGGIAQETDTLSRMDTEKALRGLDVRAISRDGLNFWQNEFSGHWAGIDLGFNLFLNPDYSGYSDDFMDNDIFRSNSLYFNVVQQSISLQRYRNSIGLVTGIGLHLQSYRIDDNTTIRRGTNDRIEPDYLYFDQNQKSKFSMISLLVPLLLEAQVPIKQYENHFYFSAGIFGSVRIHSQTKIKYKLERREKLKVPDHYSLPDLRYGLMARTGYRGINVFVTYDLVPLFREGKGPELTPFTFGITLLSF